MAKYGDDAVKQAEQILYLTMFSHHVAYWTKVVDYLKLLYERESKH